MRESQERYKLLFDQMLDGYALHKIICDDGSPVDYRYLDINPAFEAMTGLGRDIIGKTVLEVLPDTEPYWIETYGQVALTREPVKFENYSEGVGGKWFEVIAFSPVKNQFATIIHDITERKRLLTTICMPMCSTSSSIFCKVNLGTLATLTKLVIWYARR